jgi:hypothetical protein
MRRTTVFAISAALLPGVLALAACSSAGSVKPAAAASTAPVAVNAGLSSAKANAVINAAAAEATSLQIKGSMGSGGQAVAVNLQFVKTSAAGTLTISGVPISFISVNGTTYFKLSSAFATMLGGDPSTAPFSHMIDKWVSGSNPAVAPMATSFSAFTSLSSFISQLSGSSDQLTADGTGKVDGQVVAQYKDVDTTSTPLTTQILSIPASGPALPVQEVGIGAGNSGTVTFTWNQPITVSAPPAGEVYSGS